MKLASLSSGAWLAHEEATVRFLSARCSTPEFEAALRLLNISELALERADLLVGESLEEAEIAAILEGIEAVLRGRVRELVLIDALRAVVNVLAVPKVSK